MRLTRLAILLLPTLVTSCTVDEPSAPALRAPIGERPLSSDHGDIGLFDRPDADLTDLYAFVNGGNLVLILGTNPTLPSGLPSYLFPADLTLRVHIDRHSAVTFDNPFDVATYGGTIVRPDHVAEDVTFKVTFDEVGTPGLHLEGLPPSARDAVEYVADVFDDPFISANANTQLKNVAAVVLEMPLSVVFGGESPHTILIWGTSKVGEFHGPILDHVGRAMWRSVTTVDINQLRPRDHFETTGKPPDVLILDTSRPVSFSNGRLLSDDVRLIVLGDPPSTNRSCWPMPGAFPWLAPPNTIACPVP